MFSYTVYVAMIYTAKLYFCSTVKLYVLLLQLNFFYTCKAEQQLALWSESDELTILSAHQILQHAQRSTLCFLVDNFKTDITGNTKFCTVVQADPSVKKS